MLDWMKKFLNKEEEQSSNAVPLHENKPPQKGEMETRVSYQYPSGKFRFPLIPDDKQRTPQRIEKEKQVKSMKPVQNLSSILNVQPVREARVVQKVQPVQTEQKQVKAPVKELHRTKLSESNRRPFRLTETISPIFGYKRPSEEEVVYRKVLQEDLELSKRGTSVVDAWLEKQGFLSQEPDEMEKQILEENAVEEYIEAAAWSYEGTGEEQLQAVTEIIAEVIAEENVKWSNEQELACIKGREDIKIEPVVIQEQLKTEMNTEEQMQEAEFEEVVQEKERIEPVAVVEELVSIAMQEHEEPERIEEEVEVSLHPAEENTLEQPDLYEEPERTEAEEEAEVSLHPVEENAAEQPKLYEERERTEAEEEAEVSLHPVEENALEQPDLYEERERTEAEEEAEVSLQSAEENAAEQPDLYEEPERIEAEEEAEVSLHPVEENALEQPDLYEELGENRQEADSLASVAEEKRDEVVPVADKENTREKKRFVPYNVVMLKQDKLKYAQKKQIEPEQSRYAFPSLTLLNVPNHTSGSDTEWLDMQTELLNTTFFNFNIGAKVVHVTQGPAVTRFEVQPDPGVKVNKITNLSDDIKLNLSARDIRIEAPIPGKNAVGVEVPNKQSKPVFMREILRSPVFIKDPSPLTVALGLDISGAPIVTDIRKMPHGLIAGATGSGKSVCINAILTSILYKALPHEVKLLLIDPKMVELAPYNHIPHLVSPVITDVKAATGALKWAVEEMEKRYEMFAHAGVRDLSRYNDLVKQNTAGGEALPYIVIVIDELADLMMVAPADVEEAICRIAQKARACGIHLLVATQRPSVDVITGLIKANIPTRIAFTVSSQVDSRTIIDISGAEKLLGRGDMLFLENGTSKPIRVQGVYVSDEEIERAVAHVKEQMKPNYLFQQEDLLAKVEQHETEDELFFEACQFVLDQGGASTSSVQRRFRIGYNRAARLIEEMELQGIISEQRGTKPRDVLITEEDLAALQEMNV
ncbi:DNA translocase FtsK [Bacillus sp. 165]|uniref:DNA translocase FtsK n=1 Tax=Bacillus sp. 165 TaxID=1529117 RepID=UPI001ADCCB56|nr:DNA translocase FtsK [Bacillus sp. 165]MBO9131231.1 DNA translocase FtsK [Bacillus sp. 165]